MEQLYKKDFLKKIFSGHLDSLLELYSPSQIVDCFVFYKFIALSMHYVYCLDTS